MNGGPQPAEDVDSRRRANLAGAGLMLAAVVLLTALDTILRILVARHDPIFLAWGRNAVQVVYLLLLMPFVGPGRMLRTTKPWLHLARGALLLSITVLIVMALARLPMAQTYAITLSTPLLATALAAILLGERITLRQGSLIASGFGGVLIALNPTGPSAGLALAIPLVWAVVNALFFVLTRYGGRDQDPYALLFYVGLVAAGLATPTLPVTASAMRADEWALLAIGGLFGTCAHMCIIHALRLAPTAVVAPMTYAQILVAGAIGFLVFGEIPSGPTLAGGLVIATAGILLLRSPPAPVR